MDMAEVKIGHIVTADRLTGEWEIVEVDEEQETVLVQTHPDAREELWVPVEELFYV